MKKFRNTLLVILSVISILLSYISVSAEDTEYYLKDLGMSLNISDTLTVKTAENSTLPKGYYLEATNEDSTLRISIAMEKNEITEKVDSFANQSSTYLDELKFSLQNEGLSEVKDATYGSVPFLDYKQTTTSESGAETFELHSITCIGGMSIAIASESIGDNFTSDELAVIKSALESISFDSIKTEQKETAKKTTKKWILSILLIALAGGLGVFVFLYFKKAKKKKAFLAQHKENRNYDVLRGAELSHRKAEQNNLGGYKTSADFFDEHFDNTPDQNIQQNSIPATENTPKKKASPLTRMGYFAKNLSREINKSKAKGKKSKSKKKRKAEDFDIFSTK